MIEHIKKACEGFITDEVTQVSPFGDGHINDTYYVKTERGAYVCQRLQRRIPLTALEHNYRLHSKACKEAGMLFPEWLQTREGHYFYADGNGDHWRLYPLIEGTVLSAPLTEDELFSCGQGLAGLHKLLQKLQGEPVATYPMLHDLGHYYVQFLRRIEGDGCLEEQRDAALEKLIQNGVDGFLSLRLDKSKVVHGDPKLANILFQNGRVKAFLDFDTVMRGTLLEDVADCVRSCCIRDGAPDREAMRSLVQGYREAASEFLGDEEIALLPVVLEKLCFELGLRYYVDAIAVNKVFREKYPGYRLEKARGYLEMTWA